MICTCPTCGEMPIENFIRTQSTRWEGRTSITSITVRCEQCGHTDSGESRVCWREDLGPIEPITVKPSRRKRISNP